MHRAPRVLLSDFNEPSSRNIYHDVTAVGRHPLQFGTKYLELEWDTLRSSARFNYTPLGHGREGTRDHRKRRFRPRPLLGRGMITLISCGFRTTLQEGVRHGRGMTLLVLLHAHTPRTRGRLDTRYDRGIYHFLDNIFLTD